MTADAELLELLDVPYAFQRQPDPIPASLRPERRIPLLLLLVDKSYASGAGWKALQVLSWALRNPAHGELLLAVREGRDAPDRALVRIEPALDRAIDLAVGLGLVQNKGKRVYRLTPEGRRIVDAIKGSDALAEERGFLDKIGGKVSQAEVNRLLEWRGT